MATSPTKLKMRRTTSTLSVSDCTNCTPQLSNGGHSTGPAKLVWYAAVQRSNVSDDEVEQSYTGEVGPETATVAENWAKLSRPSSAPWSNHGVSSHPSKDKQSASSLPTSSRASFTPRSFVMHSEDTRALSLYAALDPNRVIIGNSEGNDAAAVDYEYARSSGQDDPIDLNIISRPSAEFLFEGSSYFTDRPHSSTPIAEEAASRGWLTLDRWTYPLGDGKAIGGFELTRIAQPVYNLMMKSREQHMLYSTDTDNLALQVVLSEFNERLTKWGEYWPPIFSKFPGSEPWQVPLIHFFRDYMRLSFNSVLLHRILVADDNNPLQADAEATILVCYSSAMRVLRETIQLGKLDVLYYLWDTAHLMMAYAAMMLLKLMKQCEQIPGISIEEGFKILTAASAIYSTAADSLGSSHEELHPAMAPADTQVAAQARLLAAIVFLVRSEFGFREPSIDPRNDLLSGASSTQLQPVDPCSTPMDNSFPWNEPTESMLSGRSLYSNDGPQIPKCDLTERMGFPLEAGFIDSRFKDAGLLAWDKPGIFIDPW
ncbi:hypothetical protein BDV12DRAFT_204706 [Aspergillus spectabilis]